MLYGLCFLVLCEWGEWETEECSQSCGGGIRIHSREKTVEELFTICEGDGYYDEDCNDQECPGNNKLNFKSVSCMRKAAVRENVE